MITALILVAGLVTDGGAALNAKVHALDVAQEAARSGAQALDLARYRATGQAVLNPAQATANARRYLTAAGTAGTVTVTGTQVTVTVHATVDTPLLSLGGLHHLTVTASGTAQAVRGITAADRGFADSAASAGGNPTGGAG
jgi:Flp pilus assembly protein TadG